jgi:ABC-type Mn2+/Zn2+ transport system ATPase subunit
MLALQVKNLKVAYETETVLENISFEVNAGDIVAIIGPNGSGKTTLIKAILGLVPVAVGFVYIFEKEPKRELLKVGYVPQRFYFDKNFPITVEEFLNLSMTQRTYGRNKLCAKTGECDIVTAKLREVGMDVAHKKLLGELSGGQLQRVLMARAILNEPNILFLDEPAAGVDIGGEDTFYDIISHLHKDHGTTIVFVSHEIDIVFKFATKVICVNKQMLCIGAPKDVLDARTIKALYGEDVGIYQHRVTSIP